MAEWKGWITITGIKKVCRACAKRIFAATAFLLCAGLLAGLLSPVWSYAEDGGFTLPPGTRLGAVAYGNGIYVVTGGNGEILVSPDGTSWTVQSVYESADERTTLYDVVYGNGIFVVTGMTKPENKPTAGLILTSGNGERWSVQKIDTECYGVFYGNGRFVVNSGPGVYTSPDGVSWTYTQGYQPRSFCAGCFINIAVNEAFISQDGVNWTEHDFSLFDMPVMPSTGLPNLSVTGMVYGKGMIVAVGKFFEGITHNHDTYPVVLKSPDGISWTEKRLDKSCLLTSIAYGNGVFVAAENRGGILTSPDGENWTPVETGTRAVFAAVSYCNNNFVAVGYNGAVSTSPDGANWSDYRSAYAAAFTVGKRGYVLNGQTYTMDAAPFVESGRVFVPVRYMADAMGAYTDWQEDTQSVFLGRGLYESDAISLTIGSTTLNYNGYDTVMDVAPVIRNGRTYLPARYIADAFGYTVSWDQTSKTVSLR